GLHHATADADNILLDDPAFREAPAVGVVQPGVQLGPDAVVRPVAHLLIRVALEIEPLQRRGAGADQREATLVVRVDQLVGRRRLHQNAKPTEGTGPRVFAPRPGWDGRQRDAVAAVATRDEIARQLTRLAVVPEEYPRRRRIQAVQAGVLGLKQDAAARLEA